MERSQFILIPVEQPNMLNNNIDQRSQIMYNGSVIEIDWDNTFNHPIIQYNNRSYYISSPQLPSHFITISDALNALPIPNNLSYILQFVDSPDSNYHIDNIIHTPISSVLLNQFIIHT
jgi:hypothetical protein